MIEVEINGLDELRAKLRKLPQVMADATVNGQETAIEQAEAYAVQKLQSSVKHSTGELARSFKHEVKTDGDEVIGRWWNSSMVAIFREFGTGLVGEQSDKQLPPNVAITYRQTPWYIPADEVDIDLTKIYGIPKMKIKGKYFYRTSGQPARQFMTPAANRIAREAPNIIKNVVDQELRDKLGG
ncbi:HK97 gp10 family phage protein [Limosilactobacillus sp. STM2_1]|uniref:HK97 gp10 family phage protein n=1 Tax=Limosilactobacillus rudii TaxID=2759755 RepID=A0A7W3UJW0_9LACO|nr:HK97-gp10 family putative phage morphogenesis protein [Limosilactobacillus rudii]MBB1080247.1 HK97 gp10 family phage protein [Limosilactobacillus rudii]MBB1096849.1 HK97 gp10 family phage protein [Limosilactobacillus rudii]MCD7133747.1 HK97 gp10 family phage protein [Limosilactobacillus rudii]